MKLHDILVGCLAIIIAAAVTGNNANAKTVEAPEKKTVALKVVSQKQMLKKYQNATSLTDRELKNLLSTVGFNGKSLKMAWAIAKAETNGRPLAFNGNRKTGDSSYGIFQINMIGALGPERRDKFDLRSNVELFNPVKNAEVALHMSGSGSDWSAWKNGQTPRVRHFLKVYNKIF